VPGQRFADKYLLSAAGTFQAGPEI